jgi:hypothetical protein
MVRLPFLSTLPLMKDEVVYSIMIEEQVEQKTMIPTLFGYEVPWKPPLFFWTYSLIVPLLKNPDFFNVLPLEAIYRLPTLFFGLINLILFYYIMKRMVGKGPELFLTTFIFNVMLFTVYITNTVLLDTYTFTFIFLALLCYLKKEWPQWRFIVAGILVFLGFMTKLLLAAVAPVIALIYFFFNDRKVLFNPLFVISLLAVPIAAFSFYSMFENRELPTNVYLIDIFGKFFLTGTLIEQLKASFSMFFFTTNIWFALSLFGLYKYWKDNLTMSTWYALIVIPLFAAPFMPWHFFMIIPPVVYFAAKVLLYENKKLKLDAFFVFGLSIVLIISIFFTNWFYLDFSRSYRAEREVGDFLAFKENVAVIGDYTPTIISNKILTEKLYNGSYLDFGWIFFTKEVANKSEWEPTVISDFAKDYHTKKYETYDGDFSMMFWKRGIFRKDTNISKFDYIVITGYANASADGELIYNRDGIRIYKNS